MNTRFHNYLIIFVAGLVSVRCVAGADEITNATASVTNTTLSLTMRECVERALQNNLNIQLERLAPTIANWGVVNAQGVYDPTFTGSAEHANEESAPFSRPLTNDTDRTLTFSPSLRLSGSLPSGATYDLASAAPGGGPTWSNFTYRGSTVLSLTQPLLKNSGFGINSTFIRIARKNREIAVQNFTSQVINTISSTKNAYYELVYAIENHKARLEDLRYAQELLDQTRRKVQIGVMSPLDVTQAESGVATRELAVILAERAIIDGQDALALLISQDVREFRNQTIVPVNYPVMEMVSVDQVESIRTALEMRPDYRAAKESVEIQNINLKYDRNQLWPSIDLNGSYGWNGNGGGLGNWGGDISSGDYPVWVAGVSVSFPLGNRRARSNYQTSRLQVEQALLQLKQLEQQIIVGVHNAAGRVRTNAKSVQSSAVATRLSEESLKAEQSKLSAGTSTTFLVLQAQSQLAVTRTAEIRTRADYSQSLVALDQAEGTTLEKENITLDEKF